MSPKRHRGIVAIYRHAKDRFLLKNIKQIRSLCFERLQHCNKVLLSMTARRSSDLPSLLRRAIEFHQLGSLERAESLYREAISRESGSAVTHHALGLLLAQSGRYLEAEKSLIEATCLSPTIPAFKCSLGNTQLALGKTYDALLNFESALEHDPDHVDSLVGKAICLDKLNDSLACVACLRRALLINPLHNEANRQLALKLIDSGQDRDASNCLRELVRQQPDDLSARLNLAAALLRTANYSEALVHYQHATALSPHNAEIHNDRCVVLHHLGRLQEAVEAGQTALQLDPQLAVAYFNLGNVCCDFGDYRKACALYERAISLNPTHAEAFYNLGNARLELKDVEDAIKHYDQALIIRPTYQAATWNKCVSLLSAGRYEDGWPLYEARWQQPGIREQYQSTKPRWTGTNSLTGKTLLLVAEQGFGDTIQFCRFADPLKARGAKIILLAPRRLHDVLSTVRSIDHLTSEPVSDEDIDFWCPLLSVPLALKVTLENLPNATPYLGPEKTRVEQWKTALGPKTQPRVGLAWSGSATNAKDQTRSLPLQLLSEILPSSGITFISLQHQVRPTDQNSISWKSLRHFGEELDRGPSSAFTDTIALCALMDVVVSVDTSIAHVAAASNCPTWLLLAHVPDWRWLLNGTESAWYPSIKLYRQGTERRWEPVLERLAWDLRHTLLQ
jgi:tetratricopeptide (TPR) repeat protein